MSDGSFTRGWDPTAEHSRDSRLVGVHELTDALLRAADGYGEVRAYWEQYAELLLARYRPIRDVDVLMNLARRWAAEASVVSAGPFGGIMEAPETVIELFNEWRDGGGRDAIDAVLAKYRWLIESALRRAFVDADRRFPLADLQAAGLPAIVPVEDPDDW